MINVSVFYYCVKVHALLIYSHVYSFLLGGMSCVFFDAWLLRAAHFLLLKYYSRKRMKELSKSGKGGKRNEKAVVVVGYVVTEFIGGCFHCFAR